MFQETYIASVEVRAVFGKLRRASSSRVFDHGPRLLLPLLIVLTWADWAEPKGPTQNKVQACNGEISLLIDKLQDVAAGDIGYMPTMSGGGFLPLRVSAPGAMLLGQAPPERSGTVCELVKRGAAAIPQLAAHLDDARPTKIVINHDAPLGAMFFIDEYDYNRRSTKKVPEGVNRDMGLTGNHPNAHTVTVGDLCFVVLGQIVNRSFDAVRYQPTACIMINSPTYSESLRKTIKKEWADLTPARHKESLVRDFLAPDWENRRIGACLRLGYYYPDALEPLVLKQLAEPRYDIFEVHSLIRDKLYRAKDAKERKRIFDEFIAKLGEVTRQGIVLYIFGDLFVDEGSGGLAYPSARACLVELFGYPNDVKSQDKPQLYPIENCAQDRFISILVHFPSPKIDQAVRQLLRTTESQNLANACAYYLAGRGADDAIREYVKQHQSGADTGMREHLEHVQERLGWTPLHAAVENDQREMIERLILQGAAINARAANGRTPLHVAAHRDDCRSIDLLIANGADVNARAIDGQTPLHLAAAWSHMNAIRNLLKAKANPNATDRQGRTPVQTAMDDTGVVMLLAGGAGPPDIFAAVIAGRVDLVERFLTRDKASVHAKTPDGRTPLHLAAGRGYVKVAGMLVAQGADVNARDRGGRTPLHWAATQARPEMVELLLAHNADRTVKDDDGRTPLDLARESENAKIIRLLETER